MVQEERRAPDFTIPYGGGGGVALKDLRGKKVVLFFYPRDDNSKLYCRGQEFCGALTQIFGQWNYRNWCF